MNRKEEKGVQQEKLTGDQAIGYLKKYLLKRKLAAQENKQKTPIITKYYTLLTIILII